MQTVHLLINGKVQGVFYRATAKKMAEKIGITGWIKNTKDNQVEAIVTGDEDKVEKFIKWCRQGPHNAVVTGVVVNEKEAMHFDSFEIKH